MKKAQGPRERLVLLYGPPFGRDMDGAVGGGVGGFTRNMETYIQTLSLPNVAIQPLFHTVRGQRGGLLGTLPMRMIIDCWRIVKDLLSKRPDAVHVLGTSKDALPRAAFLVLFSKIMQTPCVFDIKAGRFIDSYTTGSPLYRLLTRFIVKQSTTVLAEGEVYLPFLSGEFGVNAHYFPNFVDDSVIPTNVPDRLIGDDAKVLFVGHCYEGKGVFELVEGCARVARSGVRLTLTLIGQEAQSFSSFLDAFNPPNNLSIQRLSKKSFAEVRDAMLAHDVFCFPSRHVGEGHSNAINEAMMSGMIIACTRHGFLESVVGDGGYFMDTGSAEEIVRALLEILDDIPAARLRAGATRTKLLSSYTSTGASVQLSKVYARLFK